MNIDSVTFVGKNHTICQDYVRTSNGRIILSDGCSNSKDTDIGSRLLVLSAEYVLNNNANMEGQIHPYLAVDTIKHAKKIVSMAGLPSTCLDATLLVAKICPGIKDHKRELLTRDYVHIEMHGDGVVAHKVKDRIYTHQISYPITNAAGQQKEYPFYINYISNPERRAEWHRALSDVGGEKENTKHLITISDLKWNILESFSLPLGKAVESGVAVENKKYPFNHYGTVEYQTIFPHPDTEWVALMSDGVGSFTQVSREPGVQTRKVPVNEVLSQLLNIQNFKGVFVQREGNYFKKQTEKMNWQHSDDLSLAVMYLKNEP